MTVGDLVKMKNNGTLWLASEVICGTILVTSIKTNHTMWANKEAFEVINESR